jgi:branched-subunit amino acid transport protein AzlD
MPDFHPWAMVAVIALVTAGLRFLPFWLFGGERKVPPVIGKLSKTLPFAVMGMLVVYCLRSISFAELSGFVPALIATAVVVCLHIWRRNTLLSIIAGTLCYMLLVQYIF